MKYVTFACTSALVWCLWAGCYRTSPGERTDKGKTPIGGTFENSDYALYGIPDRISPADTSPGWKQDGQKLLITGTIFQADGKTPAPNVLLYYYHTNTAGRYQHRPGEPRSMPPNELGQTHGYIRGWVKSDNKGQYFIFTVRPGTYPTRDAPAHIHVTIQEPKDINAYYIDDYVFDDDPLLKTEYRRKMENRGGSGVLRLVQQGHLLVGERNIILGLHIPGYPDKKGLGQNTGRQIGDPLFSFTPMHAWGSDKGTATCPLCKYGWYHGVLFFVGNTPRWDEIKQWLTFFDAESARRLPYLKVCFVNGNEKGYDRSRRFRELEALGRELNLIYVALTFVPSLSDSASEVFLNEIDPDKTTILLYKRGIVVDRFTDLTPAKENYTLVTDRLDQTINSFFYLNRLP